MKTTVLALCLATAFAGASRADTPVMQPGSYRSLAQAASNLVRVINRYDAFVAREDPLLLMDGEGILSTNPCVLPAVLGDVEGRPQQLDVILYLRFWRSPQLTLRALFLFSGTAFSLVPETLSAYPEFHSQGISTGWSAGYALAGLQAEWREARFTVGGMLRYTPTTFDLAGDELFDTYYDDEGDLRTSEIAFRTIYADGELRGYRLSTLLSVAGLEQLAASKMFSLLERRLAIGPALYYNAAVSLFEPGLSAGLRLWDRVDLAGGVFAGFGPGAAGVPFSQAFLEATVPFVLHRYPDVARPLTLAISAKGSLTSVAGIPVPGFRAELGISHLKLWNLWSFAGIDTYFDLTAGLSYDDTEALRRLPLERQWLIPVRLSASMYERQDR